MHVRAIPRAALDAYLKALRLPLDVALRAADAEGGATRAVDRLDAAVRDLVGRLTADDELRRDARRRRATANAVSAGDGPADSPADDRRLPGSRTTGARTGAERTLARAARRRRQIMAATPRRA